MGGALILRDRASLADSPDMNPIPYNAPYRVTGPNHASDAAEPSDGGPFDASPTAQEGSVSRGRDAWQIKASPGLARASEASLRAKRSEAGRDASVPTGPVKLAPGRHALPLQPEAIIPRGHGVWQVDVGQAKGPVVIPMEHKQSDVVRIDRYLPFVDAEPTTDEEKARYDSSVTTRYFFADGKELQVTGVSADRKVELGTRDGYRYRVDPRPDSYPVRPPIEEVPHGTVRKVTGSSAKPYLVDETGKRTTPLDADIRELSDEDSTIKDMSTTNPVVLRGHGASYNVEPSDGSNITLTDKKGTPPSRWTIYLDNIAYRDVENDVTLRDGHLHIGKKTQIALPEGSSQVAIVAADGDIYTVDQANQKLRMRVRF
jgi:hypothetical protein